MGMLQGAIGVGATALIARAVGAKHKREAHAALGQAITLAVIAGIIMGAFFYIAAPFLGQISGLSGKALELSTMYLRYTAAVAPFMCILFIGGACLRGAGDFKTASTIMLAVNAVNIIISFTLVRAPEPIGQLAVRGIAIGTVIAWIVGAILMLAFLFKQSQGIKLHAHRLRIHGSMIKRILRVGIPSLAENLIFWMGNFIVLIIITRFNTGDNDVIGAHIIAIRLLSFSFLPGIAFSLAAATMTGQHLGAKNIPLAKKSAWACWAYGTAIMTSAGILFLLFPESLVSLISSEKAYIDLAAPVLFVAGWGQLTFSTTLVLSGAMRGAGDTRTPMFINFLCIYLVRLPLAWFMAYNYNGSLTLIWLASYIELVVRSVTFLTIFLSGKWTKTKV